MNAGKLVIAIMILLMSSVVAKAQEAIDTTQKKNADTTAIKKAVDKKTEKKQEEKKSKEKKKEKASKMDKILAEKKAEDPANSDSSQTDKNKKGKASKKTNTTKTAKVEPKPEPKIIPGAEAKANAEVKDKEDRTMKGPSGQKVYSSPKGGKYYMDVNGNKIISANIPIEFNFVDYIHISHDNNSIYLYLILRFNLKSNY